MFTLSSSHSKQFFSVSMATITVFDAELGIIEGTGKLVIKNFLKAASSFQPGKNFESDPFMVGDTEMTIRVHPNGKSEKFKGNVSIFLSNKSRADVNVKCQFITDVVAKEFDYVDTVAANSTWGFSQFMSHDDCTEAYRDKDFVVTAKVEIPGENVKLIGGQMAAAPKRFHVLENVYKKMQRTDFMFVCDNGEEVPCHKHILSAASPVLEAMVENEHKEAFDGKANLKLSEDAGRAFIRFIYTGDVEKDLLKEYASEFLAAGEFYDLKELKDLAEVELLNQLDKQNMVDMISIGELYRAEAIFEAALNLTKTNMAWLRSQVC